MRVMHRAQHAQTAIQGEAKPSQGESGGGWPEPCITAPAQPHDVSRHSHRHHRGAGWARECCPSLAPPEQAHMPIGRSALRGQAGKHAQWLSIVRSFVVPAGRHVVPAGRYVVPAGRHVVPSGRRVVRGGQHVVPAGRHVVPGGRHVRPEPCT